jgi:RHS repeat-associated protein
MVYDALDRRVKQPNGSVILYGPDGSKLAVMSGQTVTRAFVPLPGGATAVYQGTTLAWYRHADWLGSSRLASTPGTRTVYYDGAYSPLGETIGETGTADRSFTGQNQDLGATDEYDFMYRQYHATQGRWIQPDPGGLASVDPTNPQTWNRYAYVHNSPLANVDPDGQGIIGDIFRLILGAIQGLLGPQLPTYSGGGWNEQVPGVGKGGGILGGNLGDVFKCGGPLGTCGALGAGPWSELSGLGDVQDPGRFVNDLQGVDRIRCAALGSNSWSLNVGLSKALGWAGYNPDSFLNSALFGSSTATFSNAITGPRRLYSGAQLVVNAPGKYNMVNVAKGAVGKVPVAGMGTVQLAADSGGRIYGKAWAGATLGGKGAFKAISKAMGVASMIGLAWDVGTYGGAYYLCGQIK